MIYKFQFVSDNQCLLTSFRNPAFLSPQMRERALVPGLSFLQRYGEGRRGERIGNMHTPQTRPSPLGVFCFFLNVVSKPGKVHDGVGQSTILAGVQHFTRNIFGVDHTVSAAHLGCRKIRLNSPRNNDPRRIRIDVKILHQHSGAVPVRPSAPFTNGSIHFFRHRSDDKWRRDRRSLFIEDNSSIIPVLNKSIRDNDLLRFILPGRMQKVT